MDDPYRKRMFSVRDRFKIEAEFPVLKGVTHRMYTDSDLPRETVCIRQGEIVFSEDILARVPAQRGQEAFMSAVYAAIS